MQGRGVEYHKDSLPVASVANTVLHEPSADYLYSRQQDPFAIWIESYKQLNEKERNKLITFIVREGILEMITRLNVSDNFIE